MKRRGSPLLAESIVKRSRNNEPEESSSTADEANAFRSPFQRAYSIQKQSTFFGKFPAEIRNRIYDFLLVADEIVNPGHQRVSTNNYGCGKVPAGLDATIARTCRAALLESYPILYGRNVFAFVTPDQINRYHNLVAELHAAWPPSFLDDPFISSSLERWSLIRHVSLHGFINGRITHGVRPGHLSDCTMIKLCLRALNKFPALEHLCIDFACTSPRPAELVKIGGEVTSSLARGPAGLRKLTLKCTVGKVFGVDLDPLVQHLRKQMVSGVQLEVETLRTVRA